MRSNTSRRPQRNNAAEYTQLTKTCISIRFWFNLQCLLLDCCFSKQFFKIVFITLFVRNGNSLFQLVVATAVVVVDSFLLHQNWFWAMEISDIKAPPLLISAHIRLRCFSSMFYPSFFNHFKFIKYFKLEISQI